MNALVDFFRGEAAAFGHKGDYEGWTPEQTAIHFLREHMLCTVSEPPPIPMILTCVSCGARHIDEGEFATKRHHTHACQSCGLVWRPAIASTVGVQFLPGFKNEEPLFATASATAATTAYASASATSATGNAVTNEGTISVQAAAPGTYGADGDA